MTAHTFDGLISLIRNLSVYRSDKTVAQQKEEACTYAAALAGQAPKVPELRMLTEGELEKLLGRFFNPAHANIVQRKCAEVWGLTLSAEPTKEPK
jgi:hypothetical protein